MNNFESFYLWKATEANWYAIKNASEGNWEMVLEWGRISEGWLIMSYEAAQAEGGQNDIDLEEVDRIIDFQEISLTEIESDWEEFFILAEMRSSDKLLSSTFLEGEWGYWDWEFFDADVYNE